MLVALLAVLSGCGGSSAVKQSAAPSRQSAAPSTQSAAPSTQSVKQAFVAYLKRKELTYRWVACVRNGRRYHGRPIVRCNVNFGMDPHVEAYCAVYEQGRLTTNHENGAIPCGHDNAGFKVPVESSSS